MDTGNRSISGGGRPPKFCEPSRPVTVTLPDSTLRKLESVSDDRAKAIVKCVDAVVGTNDPSNKQVELVEVGAGKAIIIVGPSKALRTISWLRLVELAPTRFLMSIPSGVTTETLEVTIQDLIAESKDQPHQEQALLKDLSELFRHHRRTSTVSKGEMIFVDI